jgi:hypothetical protein
MENSEGAEQPQPRKDEWEIPNDVAEKIRSEFQAVPGALNQDWGKRTILIAPRRSLVRWLRKACEATAAGAVVICLTKASVRTRWWSRYVEGKASEIRFLPFRRASPGVMIVYRPDYRPPQEKNKSWFQSGSYQPRKESDGALGI